MAWSNIYTSLKTTRLVIYLHPIHMYPFFLNPQKFFCGFQMIRSTRSVFCFLCPVVFETDMSFHGFVQEFPFSSIRKTTAFGPFQNFLPKRYFQKLTDSLIVFIVYMWTEEFLFNRSLGVIVKNCRYVHFL